MGRLALLARELHEHCSGHGHETILIQLENKDLRLSRLSKRLTRIPGDDPAIPRYEACQEELMVRIEHHLSPVWHSVCLFHIGGVATISISVRPQTCTDWRSALEDIETVTRAAGIRVRLAAGSVGPSARSGRG